MYERFSKLMQENGVTAYQIAKATGISQSTFSDWKNGRSIPKADKLQKIADFFAVTVDFIVSGDENEQKNSAVSDNANDTRAIMEFEELINRLPPEKQRELLHYARYLAGQPRKD